MMTRLMTAVSATALSLTLLAGAAPAQDLGLQQLQDSATTSMAQLGMDTSMVQELTLEELAQIQSVTSGSLTRETQIEQVEAILRDANERIAAGGAVVPSGPTGDISAGDFSGDQVVAANVSSFLAQLGMSEVDANTLSTEQLLQIQLLQDRNDSDELKRRQIEEIIGSN